MSKALRPAQETGTRPGRPSTARPENSSSLHQCQALVFLGWAPHWPLISLQDNFLGYFHGTSCPLCGEQGWWVAWAGERPAEQR